MVRAWVDRLVWCVVGGQAPQRLEGVRAHVGAGLGLMVREVACGRFVSGGGRVVCSVVVGSDPQGMPGIRARRASAFGSRPRPQRAAAPDAGGQYRGGWVVTGLASRFDQRDRG